MSDVHGMGSASDADPMVTDSIDSTPRKSRKGLLATGMFLGGALFGSALGLAIGQNGEETSPEEALATLTNEEIDGIQADQTHEACVELVVGDSIEIDFTDTEAVEATVAGIQESYADCMAQGLDNPFEISREQYDDLNLSINASITTRE